MPVLFQTVGGLGTTLCVRMHRRGLDNNHLEGVVLVDLSKAFDSVNHDLLLCKMDRYGIRGREQRWFHSYLSGRKQRVVIDGELSS